MKLKNYFIILLVLAIGFVYLDYKVYFQGKGMNIIGNKITPYYNPRYDEGYFTIKYDDFFDVIAPYKKIVNNDDTIIINKILSYGYDGGKVICHIVDKKGREYLCGARTPMFHNRENFDYSQYETVPYSEKLKEKELTWVEVNQGIDYYYIAYEFFGLLLFVISFIIGIKILKILFYRVKQKISSLK